MYKEHGLYLPSHRKNNDYRTEYRQDPPPDYEGFKERKKAFDTDHSTDELESENEKSFKRLIIRFAEKTSMQGVGYINSARLWYSRLLWTFLLIACTVGMTLHLYYLIHQFLSWPIQTKIDLGFSNLLFPAVTICNVNPIRNSQTHLASENLQSLLYQLDWSYLSTDSYDYYGEESSRRKKRFVDELSKVNTSMFQDYETYYDYLDYDYSFGTEVDPRAEIMEIFTDLYRSEERSTKIAMGHQLDHMLISCTIGKFKCYANNFTLLQHETYGNCYTLQFDKLKISKSGPNNGLTLILYMQKEDYLTQINEGYGARISIQDTNTYPFPGEEGFFVPSSSETQIGLRRVAINRQSQPYGTCTEDIYSAKFGFKYTRGLCQILCLQDKIFEKCGCFNNDNNELNWQINNTMVKYCKTREEVKCMLNQTSIYDKNKGTCLCHNPCSENQFTKTISHRNWPSEDFMYTLKVGVCDRLPDQCYYAQNLFDVAEEFKKGLNYVKVNIFYEDLNFEQVEEEPEIETAQFASDVGGAVGLWIGLSFLSMFEVVQLCLECCSFCLHKCKNRKKKRKQKSKRNNRSIVKPNIYLIDGDYYHLRTK